MSANVFERLKTGADMYVAIDDVGQVRVAKDMQWWIRALRTMVALSRRKASYRATYMVREEGKCEWQRETPKRSNVF